MSEEAFEESQKKLQVLERRVADSKKPLTSFVPKFEENSEALNAKVESSLIMQLGKSTEQALILLNGKEFTETLATILGTYNEEAARIVERVSQSLRVAEDRFARIEGSVGVVREDLNSEIDALRTELNALTASLQVDRELQRDVLTKLKAALASW
jgi:hypothetical protein